MARVKIKVTNSKDPRKKAKLLEILSTNNIYITKIIPINDGFIILTENDNELDKIFNNKTDQELNKNGYAPIIPPQLRANRSILIFRVDDHIYSNEEHQIKEEIIKENGWVESIDKIFKFPKSNIIKVTFNETSKAQKAQEKGLLMFSMRVPTHDIKQDTYFNIMTCLKCYKMEDHSTAQCEKERNYKICSECSKEGHIWKECESTTKKMHKLQRRTCNTNHEMPQKEGDNK